MSATRPPLGAKPRKLWLEDRAHDLSWAIALYNAHSQSIGEPPNLEKMKLWIRELIEVLELLDKGAP